MWRQEHQPSPQPCHVPESTIQYYDNCDDNANDNFDHMRERQSRNLSADGGVMLTTIVLMIDVVDDNCDEDLDNNCDDNVDDNGDDDTCLPKR